MEKTAEISAFGGCMMFISFAVALILIAASVLLHMLQFPVLGDVAKALAVVWIVAALVYTFMDKE